jgi:hypothetical protein
MLKNLLEKALHAGGDQQEIEYGDRKEWFTAFKGPIGFAIGSLDSEHPKLVFAEMDELKKKSS